MGFDDIFRVRKRKGRNSGVFIEPRAYVKSFGDYSIFTKIGKRKPRRKC